MSFKQKTCFEIVCDGGCDDPWEEGTPHFDSEAEAVKYARDCGWIVTDGRALCSQCSTRADCAVTGHRWEDWRDRDLHCVRYRQRWCEHCGVSDYDPPFAELQARLEPLREAERIVADAAGGDASWPA